MLKVTYSATVTMAMVTTALAAEGIAYSSEITNTSNRYQDYLISIHAESTLAAASTVFCFVKVHPANDSTNYTDYNNGIIIGSMDFSTATAVTGYYNLSNYFMAPPPNFKVSLRNKSGAALSTSNHWANYVGINIENT